MRDVLVIPYRTRLLSLHTKTGSGQLKRELHWRCVLCVCVAWHWHSTWMLLLQQLVSPERWGQLS